MEEMTLEASLNLHLFCLFILHSPPLGQKQGATDSGCEMFGINVFKAGTTKNAYEQL